MFREDQAPSRSQRLLNASWPLFRAFGVETRVHWAVVLVPIGLFCVFVANFGDLATGNHWLRWSKSDFHAGESAAWALVWTLALYFTVWTHEMAHAAVARRFGVATKRVAISPFGGLMHPAAPMPDARAEFWTALAGPAVQFASAALLAGAWAIVGFDGAATDAVGWARWPQMYVAFLVLQVAIGAFNLLPVFPLDGGRCLRAAFAARMPRSMSNRWTTYVGYPGAIMLSIVGTWMLFNPMYELSNPLVATTMIFVGLTSFLHCRTLQLEAHEVESSLDPAAAWKAARAPEPWKDTIAESERLARAEDRRERRAAEARRQEELQRHKIQERIDELLDRINEVGGVENLTSAERRELAEASESLRRETAEH